MKTTESLFAVAAAASVALVACTHAPSGPGASAPSSAQVDANHEVSRCPIRGDDEGARVRVSVADAPDGVAIAFAGDARDVPALRQRVRAMDRANDQQGDAFAACPCALEPGPGVLSSTSPYGGGQARRMIDADPATAEPVEEARGQTAMQAPGAMVPFGAVPAATTVDDTPSGGVLRFTARDASQVQALRDEVRQNARAMQSGCGGGR
jgi:hypothetical protein